MRAASKGRLEELMSVCSDARRSELKRLERNAIRRSKVTIAKLLLLMLRRYLLRLKHSCLITWARESMQVDVSVKYSRRIRTFSTMVLRRKILLLLRHRLAQGFAQLRNFSLLVGDDCPMVASNLLAGVQKRQREHLATLQTIIYQRYLQERRIRQLTRAWMRWYHPTISKRNIEGMPTKHTEMGHLVINTAFSSMPWLQS